MVTVDPIDIVVWVVLIGVPSGGFYALVFAASGLLAWRLRWRTRLGIATVMCCLVAVLIPRVIGASSPLLVKFSLRDGTLGWIRR